MSLLNLSEKSKLRVFEIIGDRMTTIAQLRLTCPQLDIMAKNNNFDKVNAVQVMIRVSRTNEHHQPAGNGTEDWKIQSEIVRKKPAEEVEFIKELKKPKKTDTTGGYYNQWDAASTYRDTCEVKGDYNRMLKDVNRRLKGLIEKVKTVEKLTIEGLNITPEIVKKLSTWKNKISMVEELQLNKGECTLTAEEFTKFMQMFSLKSIKLNAFRTRNQIIGDCHLTGLTDIYMGDKQAHHAQVVLQCPGITNESLKNWMINTPNTLNLSSTRTSLTFEAVWVFIQFLVEKYRREIKGRSFNFGKLERNDRNIEEMTKAMKSSRYAWKEMSYQRNDDLKYEEAGKTEWKISEEIIRKKPEDEKEYLRENRKPKKKKPNDYNDEWEEGSTYRESHTVNGSYNRMLKDFNRKIKDLFGKVKSVESLTIDGVNISTDITQKLSVWKDKISMVKSLQLKNGECLLSAEELTRFMQLFTLTSLHFESFAPRNQTIGDCHLTGIMNITMTDHHRDEEIACLGITNETLNNWMIVTPDTIDLSNVVTFEAIWVFIQFVTDKSKTEPKSLSFDLGTLAPNDENAVNMTKAMKIMNYTWKETGWEEDERLKYELTHPLDNHDDNSAKGIKFRFSI